MVGIFVLLRYIYNKNSETMEYKKIELPMKLFMCMDKYTQNVFSTLIYYDMVASKDSEGYFSFKFKDFCDFINGSDKPVNAILNELHRLGIISIIRTGKGKGNNGRGSDINKYRINKTSFVEYDRIKNSEIKSHKIIIPPYNKRIPTTNNMVRIESEPQNPNHNSYGKDRILTTESQPQSDKNPNHNGKDSVRTTIEYTSNIIYNTSEIKEKKNIPSVGNTLSEKVKSNNEETLSEEEKNKKQSPSMVRETNITEGLDFSSLSSNGNDETSSTKDFTPISNDTNNATLQMVRNYDGNRPNLDIKYFKNPPSVIDEPTEFERYAKALLYQFRGVTNWTDYLGSRGMLNRLRKAGEASMTEEYMTTKGTRMEEYHIRRFNERYGKVDAILHKYFKLKLERLPYDGQNDMYSYFNATAMKYDAYKQTVGEIDAKQLKWKAGKYTYKFDSFINDKTIEFLTKNG